MNYVLLRTKSYEITARVPPSQGSTEPGFTKPGFTKPGFHQARVLLSQGLPSQGSTKPGFYQARVLSSQGSTKPGFCQARVLPSQGPTKPGSHHQARVLTSPSGYQTCVLPNLSYTHQVTVTVLCRNRRLFMHPAKCT